MSDFSVRSENVDVEQIMRQIRARIREKRGVDYTEEEIRELANVKLEKFIDPKGVRSGLLEEYRRVSTSEPPAPNYAFGEDTLFETHRGPIRWLRSLFRPVLKLLFNPNPLIQALHIQAELNTRQARREQLDALHYEVIHNLVVELTRTGVEVKSLKMRLESMASRLDFDERRARALEGVVEYRAGAVPPLQVPTGQDQGRQDQGRRDQGHRTQGPRDQGPRDQGRRDQGQRNQGQRNQGPRDQGPRSQGPRPQGQGTAAPGTQGAIDQGLATQGPGTQAPGTQGPGTQEPATQGPATQAPGTQAPGTQGPGTQEPATQAPATQAPATQGPGTQGPGTQGPATQGPGTQGPATQGPGTQGPGTQGPGTQGPGTQGPEGNALDADGNERRARRRRRRGRRRPGDRPASAGEGSSAGFGGASPGAGEGSTTGGPVGPTFRSGEIGQPPSDGVADPHTPFGGASPGGIEDRGPRIEDRASKTEDGGLSILDPRPSSVESRGGGSSAGGPVGPTFRSGGMGDPASDGVASPSDDPGAPPQPARPEPAGGDSGPSGS